MINTIIIWCTDAGHRLSKERNFVAEFHKEGVIWWPQPQSTRHGATGVKWWHTDDGQTYVEPGAERAKDLNHTLTCRLCATTAKADGRPLTVRCGKFDRYLDAIADTGRTSVTMAELRAIVQHVGG